MKELLHRRLFSLFVVRLSNFIVLCFPFECFIAFYILQYPYAVTSHSHFVFTSLYHAQSLICYSIALQA